MKEIRDEAKSTLQAKVNMDKAIERLQKLKGKSESDILVDIIKQRVVAFEIRYNVFNDVLFFPSLATMGRGEAMVQFSNLKNNQKDASSFYGDEKDMATFDESKQQAIVSKHCRCFEIGVLISKTDFVFSAAVCPAQQCDF